MPGKVSAKTKFGAKITAAATSGPANGPRPASSNPQTCSSNMPVHRSSPVPRYNSRHGLFTKSFTRGFYHFRLRPTQIALAEAHCKKARLDMKIPGDKIVIAEAKLTHYLLVWRPRSDKSKYLAQVGFTSDNP